MVHVIDHVLTPPSMYHDRAWAATYAAEAFLTDWSLPAQAMVDAGGEQSTDKIVAPSELQQVAANMLIDALMQQQCTIFGQFGLP